MQKLQLSIPEPCHQNWHHMTPTDQGRFCNACAKEVVDFSTMTDIQVLNYFTGLTHDKVCGRALPEQLNRTISRQPNPKKRLFWYWNYIVMFFMFFGKANAAKAQGGIKPVIVISSVKANEVRGDIAVVNVVKEGSRVISGKITDIDGNPVSFATIKIKGTSTGVSADANGVYSMRVNSNNVLVISGVSFMEIEVPVGLQSVFNTVLEKGGVGYMVILGIPSISYDETYIDSDKAKNVAVIKVMDDETIEAINNATLVVTKNRNSDTVFTDKRGVYKIKGIKNYERYFIKITADGYVPNEFTIDARDFKERKKEWEVLLRKLKVEPVRSIEAVKPAVVITKALCTKRVTRESKPLFVVDGLIMSKSVDINLDDVDDYSVLQASEATALFGNDGSNGAIVITTRKSKEIKMKELVVTSDFGIKRTGRSVGGIFYTNSYEDSFLSDTIATIKTVLTDSIKVYPNPVQRNSVFSVQLKLKQPGNNYNMQITDASGRILLQQKFNTIAKDHTEKITGDSRWAAGIHYIRVFDNKNQLVSKKSFIVR